MCLLIVGVPLVGDFFQATPLLGIIANICACISDLASATFVMQRPISKQPFCSSKALMSAYVAETSAKLVIINVVLGRSYSSLARALMSRFRHMPATCGGGILKRLSH